MKINRDWALRIVFVIYVLGVIVVSLLPKQLFSGSGILHLDKVGHFVAYAGLGILIGLTFVEWNGRFVAAVGIIGLGFLLEWGQSFVPGRDMSLADGLMNTAGILVGIYIFYQWGGMIDNWIDRIVK